MEITREFVKYGFLHGELLSGTFWFARWPSLATKSPIAASSRSAGDFVEFGATWKHSSERGGTSFLFCWPHKRHRYPWDFQSRATDRFVEIFKLSERFLKTARN